MITSHFCITDNTALSCDVLVIGSGAGGAVVAHELACAGKDVLLIEEGPAIGHDNAPLSAAEGVARLWRNGGMTVALGRPPVAYAEGRCVGGGTEINSAIIQRAPDELLDRWAHDYRIHAFSAAALEPYYDKVYRTLSASMVEDAFGPPSDLMRKAADKKGWRLDTLERAHITCVGTNMCASSCPTGGKQSVSQRLIRSALSKGLRLIAQTRIHTLKRHGHVIIGATGLARDAQGRSHNINIKCKTIFVAAGAIHTPALLRASGITKAIGNSLRLHPTMKILARFPFDVNAQDHRLPLYAVTEFMPTIRLGGSIFTPGFFGMALAEQWQAREHLLPHMRQCGMYYAMVRGQGLGRIRPVLGNRANPLVTYALADSDKNHLVQGLKHLADFMFAAGASELYPSLAGHKGWRTPQDVVHDTLNITQANLMTVHLFSSCPMGEDKVRCAADSYGRVHGLDNLYIADASLIPEAPGVNPQATIMALAYRNAENWLTQHGG